MFLARLPLTCGTMLPLVSHAGSEVSVSCPCVGLQTIGLPLLCCGPVLIDEPVQMAAMMRDMMECRGVFGLGGWAASGPRMQRFSYLNQIIAKIEIIGCTKCFRFCL